jgi:hypothetical protein
MPSESFLMEVIPSLIMLIGGDVADTQPFKRKTRFAELRRRQMPEREP